MATKPKSKKKPPQEPYAPPAAQEPPKSGQLEGLTGDGVARVSVPSLDEAIPLYVEARDQRIKFGIEEKAKKKLILAIMEDKKLASYEHDDLVVVRKPKDDTASIKVMKKADYVGEAIPGGY